MLLIPYRKGDKQGYCDRNKNITIRAIYCEVFRFDNGLARVRRHDQFGFIDEEGAS